MYTVMAGDTGCAVAVAGERGWLDDGADMRFMMSRPVFITGDGMRRGVAARGGAECRFRFIADGDFEASRTVIPTTSVKTALHST